MDDQSKVESKPENKTQLDELISYHSLAARATMLQQKIESLNQEAARLRNIYNYYVNDKCVDSSIDQMPLTLASTIKSNHKFNTQLNQLSLMERLEIAKGISVNLDGVIQAIKTYLEEYNNLKLELSESIKTFMLKEKQSTNSGLYNGDGLYAVRNNSNLTVSNNNPNNANHDASTSAEATSSTLSFSPRGT